MSLTLAIAAEFEKLGWTVERESDGFHLKPGQHQVRRTDEGGETFLEFFYVTPLRHGVCCYVVAYEKQVTQTFNDQTGFYDIRASDDPEGFPVIFRTTVSAISRNDQRLVKKIELNPKWVAALEAADIQIAIDPVSVHPS